MSLFPATLAPSMLRRLLSLIPAGWFGAVAPIRDVVMGGVADNLDWARGLIASLALQTRAATAGGWFLDLTSFDFLGAAYLRRGGEVDDAWRARFRREIFRERVTLKGISQAVEDLTGTPPVIVEPWAATGGGYGCGAVAYGGRDPDAGPAGGYGAPVGGYGEGATAFRVPSGDELAAPFAGAGPYSSLSYPYQVFVEVQRPKGSGIPLLSGYGCTGAGYGTGVISYVDLSQVEGAVSDAEIYATVAATVAAGVTPWVDIVG